MTTLPASLGEKSLVTDPASYRFWMIGHGHIDPVWRWTWDEGYQEVFATFRSVLDRMKEFPEISFIASSPQFYAWVEEADPDLFEEIRQRVHEGRWCLVGGWWIEPDANLPLGESIARLGLYGQRYFQEKFGRRATVGFNPDTFGHPCTFPQILRQHGLDSYFFMRPMQHEKPGLSAPVFHWEGLDGSSILTVQILSSYNCAELRDAEDDKLDPRIRDYIERYGKDQPEVLDMPIFYGMGNHGGGPTVASIRSIERARRNYTGMRHGSIEDYRDSLRPQEKQFPIIKDELLHHARGCYSACSDVKVWNRRAEVALLRAEKIAAAAQMLTGRAYPSQELRESWKKVLFNQFHDIIAGSSIEAAYEDARDDYGYALSVAKGIVTRSLQAITQKVATASGDPGTNAPFLVFNANAWPVREFIEIEMERTPQHRGTPVVKDGEGRVIPSQELWTEAPDVPPRFRVAFQAELPSLGYALYRVDFMAAEENPVSPQPARAHGNILENGLIRATFDHRFGSLKSLWDKKASRELLAGPAASPIVLDDPGDTWGHDVVSYDQELGRFSGAEIIVRENGPERARIEVTTHFGESRIIQNFILWSDSASLDVRLRVDWRAEQKVLKLGFSTVLANGEVTASVPYGFASRPADGSEMPMQTWLDLSGRDEKGAFGLALFTEGLGGYSATLGELRLTLFHSTIWSDHGPAGPRRDGYRYMEQGQRDFHYRIVVHQGSWREAEIPRQAEAFLMPAVKLPAYHHGGILPHRLSVIELDVANGSVPALKWAEDDNGWIIRCVELHGRSASGTLRLPTLQREISFDLGPVEITTWHVPADGGGIRKTNLLED